MVNFQDIVGVDGSTLFNKGDQIVIGSTTGAKSLVFSNDQFALHLVGNPGANATVSLPGGGTLLSNINVSGGTTSNNLSNIVFSNSNNVSFGLNGSTLTATATVATSLTNINLSAGTTSNNLSAVTFANSNGITFGLNASTVTASHNGLTTQTNQQMTVFATGNTTQSSTGTTNASSLIFRGEGAASVGVTGGSIVVSVPAAGGLTNINVSAGTTSNNLSNFVLSNSNNVSFGLNGSTITATVTVATSLSNIRVSAGTTSNLLSAITFADGNNVSFGLNASTLTASIATSLTNIRVSAGTTSNLLSAITFSNSNGVTFGLNASTLTASHNGITSQSNQQMTLFATGNTTQSSTGTTNASSVIFRGEGVASVGVTNGSVVVSVPAGGGGLTNINVSAGTTSNNLSAFVLSNSNNVSFGLNGSTITASINAGGGGFTYNRFAPFDEAEQIAGQIGQGSMYIQPVIFQNVQFDRMLHRVVFTNASNSTGSVTITIAVNIYTRLDQNTLSRYASTTGTHALTFSGTVGNHSLQAGPRVMSIGWTTTLTQDEYFVGIASSTATAGANASFSNFIQSQINSSFSGVLGAASASTQQRRLGQGIWTGVGTTSPATIAFSHIRGNSSAFHRGPIFLFLSQSSP